MNKLFLGVIAAVVLFSALTVCGQQLTVDEILSRVRASEDRLQHTSYVQRHVTEMLLDGITSSCTIDDTYEYIRAVDSPMVERSHTTTVITTNGKTENAETIRILGVGYTRKGLGEWTLDKTAAVPAPNVSGSFSGTGSSNGSSSGSATPSASNIEKSIKTEFLGEESINGVPAVKYQTTETFSDRGAKYYSAGFLVTTYWFDRRNRLVKILCESSNTGDKRIIRLSTEYKYDTVIKIEAPINTEAPIK